MSSKIKVRRMQQETGRLTKGEQLTILFIILKNRNLFKLHFLIFYRLAIQLYKCRKSKTMYQNIIKIENVYIIRILCKSIDCKCRQIENSIFLTSHKQIQHQGRREKIFIRWEGISNHSRCMTVIQIYYFFFECLRKVSFLSFTLQSLVLTVWLWEAIFWEANLLNLWTGLKIYSLSDFLNETNADY